MNNKKFWINIKNCDFKQLKSNEIKQLKIYEGIIDDSSLGSLIDSIKIWGLIDPVVVFVNEDGEYEMIAGHRRKRACELAGIDTIAAAVVDVDRDSAYKMHVVSNQAFRFAMLTHHKKADERMV